MEHPIRHTSAIHYALPPLNLITASLLMVPVLVLYVRLGTQRFLIHYIVCLAVVYLIGSFLLAGWLGVLLVSVSLFFLPPVIQMGNLYKKRAPARTVLTVGTITLLGESLLSLIVSYLLGLNPVGKMKQFMVESVHTLPSQLQGMMELDLDTLVQLMVQMLPLYMIGFSLFYVVVSHWLARRALVRSGESIPAFKPVKDWMLPKSFVWFYLLAALLELFIRDTSSVVFSALLNLLPLLTAAFAIQAIAFLFYVAHANRWNKTAAGGGDRGAALFSAGLFSIQFDGRVRRGVSNS
ncbi:YybS family protein [Paenibacillus sp. P26]|nr:YybS family protein [Paenibacillus sp. P26]